MTAVKVIDNTLVANTGRSRTLWYKVDAYAVSNGRPFHTFFGRLTHLAGAIEYKVDVLEDELLNGGMACHCNDCKIASS